jgi:hypothetical protein
MMIGLDDTAIPNEDFLNQNTNRGTINIKD